MNCHQRDADLVQRRFNPEAPNLLWSGDITYNCWDNAPTESFWGHLKVACVLGQRFATRQQDKAAILDWMAFYNHARLHSTLGYLSPMQYEQRWLAAQRKNAA